MTPTLNTTSSRATQARLAVLLGARWIQAVCLTVYIGLLALGIALVVTSQPVGWVAIGLAFIPILPLVWYEWWLKDLPVAKQPRTVDDVLEPDLLGGLRLHDSPQQIAQLAMNTHGGLFFAARLGVGPNFLRDVSSDDPAAAQAVWQAAQELRQELQLADISAAVVVAALLRDLPARDQLLAQLQLTFNDIKAAARWYHHLKDMQTTYKNRRRGGGIGRDLGFGYTNLLSRFATNISEQVAGGTLTRDLESHQAVLDQLTKQLTTGNRNAVLVGPTGVGKTTLVHTLASRLLDPDKQTPAELRYLQVMALEPSSLIAHAGGRGELEGLLGALLDEAHSAKNVILFFDNAELFFSNDTGAVDLRNVLLPALQASGLRIILSMDEQEWLKLGRQSPTLTQQLSRLTMPPTNEDDTLLVCEEGVLALEFESKVIFMYQALKAAHRLGARYVTDQAMPGQALHILKAASRYAKGGLVGAASVEQAVEQLYGVKASAANQGDERQMLLSLEQLIHQRMINQTRAVATVANALRRARSGVRNQNRPIGTFLFLGPTGVGKTELAKSLAAVYFGGEDHLVRVDLNEFNEASDVPRLIADATTDAHSLTAQIAKQPFSVVLLDEIEKAHPSVLSTLLQLLDEGIMRDINNREVSFRDAVIIATSNAGADRLRKLIEAGQSLEKIQPQFTDELVESGKFTPEFLNRFDDIVLFRPLNPDELLQVVDLILAGMNKTLAQQNIKVHVADAAKRTLVEVGNDPRLGARPMRRIVQRTVENIVAKRLLQGAIAPGATIEISLEDITGALEE